MAIAHLAHDDTLAAWLRLALTPGLGSQGARRLLAQFGTPTGVVQASAHDLVQVVGEPRARALAGQDAALESKVAHALTWSRTSAHHHLVTLDDPDYPSGLLQLADPPALLHVVGQRESLNRPMVAVVGSRNATAGGVAHARAFSAELSGAGLTVVSGMALGIDAAAHDGALAGGSGTVAVLGTGVDVIYPRRHLALSERIALDGALVSELPLGTAPLPGLFPRRNRLIAAMARGVLVIEAALRSGSLITARLAADYGREVFALPGSIHSPLARGCHALIKEGARLVESVEDLLSEWPGGRPRTHPPAAAHGGAHTAAQASDRISGRISARTSASPAPAGQERALSDPACGRLLAAIGHEPVLPDTLAQHLGMPSSTLGAQLVLLEIDGHVVRCPDGRVVRQGPSG